MRIRQPYRLPDDKEDQLRRAQKLEWITIGFMISIIVVIYLVMGSSQAMKTAWIEDILSLVPAIAFLVAMRVRNKPPNERFPYGYRRAVSIAFLCAAFALALFGVLLFYDSAMTLIQREYVTINTIQVFGRQVWMGWLMIAALIYSAIPPLILGRMKLPLSRELHEKVLHADADMNKADWLTAAAGVLGIIGIGLGFWWADAVAACVISLDILKDGFTNLKHSVLDLMDERPTTVDREEPDTTQERLRHELEQLDWVAEARVRLREEGDVLCGEAFVVPQDEHNLLDKLQQASAIARNLDWRIYDLVITPVRSLDQQPAPSGFVQHSRQDETIVNA